MGFVRDFIDVRDLVKALSIPLNKELFAVHNLSANQAVSIRRVINLLLKVSDNQDLGFDIGELNAADPSVIRSVTSKHILKFGWKPIHFLEESVENFWRVFTEFWK